MNDLVPALRPIYRDSPDGPVQDVRAFTEVMESLRADRGLAAHRDRYTSSTNKHVLPDMLSIPPHLAHLATGQQVDTPDLEYLGEVMRVRSRFALPCRYPASVPMARPAARSSPGSTATGRNVPKAKEFIYNAPALFRAYGSGAARLRGRFTRLPRRRERAGGWHGRLRSHAEHLRH